MFSKSFIHFNNPLSDLLHEFTIFFEGAIKNDVKQVVGYPFCDDLYKGLSQKVNQPEEFLEFSFLFSGFNIYSVGCSHHGYLPCFAL